MLPDKPTLEQYIAYAADVESRAVESFGAVADMDGYEAVRVQYLGDKRGELNVLQKALGTLPADARKEAGQAFNRVKSSLAIAGGQKLQALRARKPTGPSLDLTLPARPRWIGAPHPVTVVIDEIVAIFRELGFTVALGPESESEWYNFGALNFPPDHPAMDAHDTFYLGEGALLRTHTSPVQVRTLQRHAPPIRILAPGTVFRRDPFDASHAPAFAQLEGLAVDEGISFVDLKATLTLFARRFFGSSTRTRFRPSFFPFTEPSAEMDVECQLCTGRGCSACKGSGWMEIMGSGMVHPQVLESAGIDSERYTGWAFGMGPGRIAMLRYGIPDIRLLYDSDVRFLQQVAE
ncbi:MAG: pheS [Gemmatimonadetes bacterium]|jgi:phenylalanyl-tRNA synthetase alpha chain|nr:pheS [Gemmatimonadota bacterium]